MLGNAGIPRSDGGVACAGGLEGPTKTEQTFEHQHFPVVLHYQSNFQFTVASCVDLHSDRRLA